MSTHVWPDGCSRTRGGANSAVTSIIIYRNHAAVAHRDVGNTGPSVARTLGTFVGDELFHFPLDDGSSDPAEFPIPEAEILDTSDVCYSIFPRWRQD